MIEPGIEHLLKCLTSLAERLEPHEFLNILSAWRGPDDTDSSVKRRTTEVIRRKILDECGEGAAGVTTVDEGFVSSPTDFYGVLVASRITTLGLSTFSSYHFNNHIEWAAASLGLEVVWLDGKKE